MGCQPAFHGRHPTTGEPNPNLALSVHIRLSLRVQNSVFSQAIPADTGSIERVSQSKVSSAFTRILDDANVVRLHAPYKKTMTIDNFRKTPVHGMQDELLLKFQKLAD